MSHFKGGIGSATAVRGRRELPIDSGFVMASQLVHNAGDKSQVSERSSRPTPRAPSGRFRHPPTFAGQIRAAADSLFQTLGRQGLLPACARECEFAPLLTATERLPVRC